MTSTNSSSAMYSRASSRDNRRGGFSRTFWSWPTARTLVSFFSLVGIDVHVALAAVFADDHPLINLVAGGDEHFRAVLQSVQAKGHGPAKDHGNQHAGGPAGNHTSAAG